MYKKIIPAILFACLTVYLVSCSSGEGEKYDLLTKEDKKNISAFCKCTEPLLPFMERAQNLKDSVEAAEYLDSIGTVFKEFIPCTENLKKMGKDVSKEKEKQLLDYVQEKHPKCYVFLEGEKKINKTEK